MPVLHNSVFTFLLSLRLKHLKILLMKKCSLSLAVLVFILALFNSSNLFSCTNLIVTKKASKDGSVMLTYSADSHTRYGTLVHMLGGKKRAGAMVPVLEWGKERYLGEIPQVGYTYNVIGNMNEKQLAIGESTWGGIDLLKSPSGIMDYGSAIYFTLQRMVQHFLNL